MSINDEAIINSTAIVDDGADIGFKTKIWHWSHVCAGAKIGDNCSIGQNVYVGNNVRIGNGVKIQNNVSIYDNIFIDDFVFCGPSCVFTNVINPRSEIERKNEYLKTTIRKGSTLGANCTIVCGNNVGSYAFIGAGSVVTKNVKPFALILGVPGVQVGWMSAHGYKIDLPLRGYGTWECEHTGQTYALEGDQVCFT